jgi:low affinity Fe/Cu permease
MSDPAKKHWTTLVGQAAAHPAAFGIVLVYTFLWLIFDRNTFDFNAVATLAVWLMTLFIQRANRRDTLALHAKLDELLRVDNRARSELTRLDEHEPEVIEAHRDEEVRGAARIKFREK